MFKGFVTSISC